MFEQSVSVTTYANPEPLAVPETSSGGKRGISTIPSSGDKSEVAGELLDESRRIVRRVIPVETSHSFVIGRASPD
jgi:hypothetical protein